MNDAISDTIKSIITNLQNEIDTIFDSLQNRTRMEEAVLAFRPREDEWTIGQILEHLTLANHYLLVLIDKGRKKCLKKSNVSRIKEILGSYELSSPALEQIGINDSFHWQCPAHMEPTGGMSTIEIRNRLETQRRSLEQNLHDLDNGAGVLYRISQSVNRLGKLDVYQYIYFLLKHARRHIAQMEAAEREFYRDAQRR